MARQEEDSRPEPIGLNEEGEWTGDLNSEDNREEDRD
jgi:hypothetical protein